MQNKTKIADNTIESSNINHSEISSNKKKSRLDIDIEKEKKLISFLEELNDRSIEVNKNFNKCLELLSLSIRGDETNRQIDEFLDNNITSIAAMNETIETAKEDAKNRLNHLYIEKDEQY
jgi:hypothetical protein